MDAHVSAAAMASLLLGVSGLICGLALLAVARAHPGEPAIPYWAAAALSSAVRSFLGADFPSVSLAAAMTTDALAAAILYTALVGSAEFVGWRVGGRAPLAAALGLGAWLWGLRLLGAPERWSLLSLRLLGAIVLTVIGAAFVRGWRGRQQPLYLAMAAISFAWAATWLVSALAFSPGSEPLLNLLRGVFLQALAVGFILCANQRLEEQLRAEIAVRREAEQTALANERRFSDLVDTASDWALEFDAEQRLTYISPRIEAVTGFPPEHYIRRGRIASATLADDPEWRRLEAAIAARQPIVKARLCTEHRNGSPVTYLLTVNPIFDERGVFFGYRGTAQDVTRQLETQSALDTILGGVRNVVGEDYLSALVEHLAEALGLDAALIATLDPGRRDAITPRAFYRRDGKPPTTSSYAVAGTPVPEILEKGLRVFPRNLAHLFPDDPYVRPLGFEGYAGTSLLDPEGAPIGVLILLKKAPIDNPGTFETVLQALAPRAAAELCRQTAEDRLRDSERLFRTVLDRMPVAVLLRRDDRFTFVNKTFADWAALVPDQVEGASRAEFYDRVGLDEAEVRRIQADDRTVLTTGRSLTREMSVTLPDGTAHDIILSKFPVPGVGGEPLGIGVAATDITELRRMERGLVQAQKMEALGRLAGGVAHDFNNIVGAIAGFGRFLLEDVSDPASRHHVERILAAAQRAKLLIQQILTFTRKGELARRPVRVAELVDETVALLQPGLADRDRLQVEQASGDPAVEGDATQLAQVLMNVCVNAKDAIGDGAGRITIRTRRRRGDAFAEDRLRDDPSAGGRARGRLVAGEVDPRRNYVVVEVDDTGVGIDPATLENIFEPFFTTKPTGKGTGLGLAVVHGIVLGHGGAIAVESGPGSGTRVALWLPEADDAAASPRGAAADEDEDDAPPGVPRLLVVDDDEEFGEMLAIALERAGCRATLFDRPDEALAVFLRDPEAWDAVVSDHAMPGMRGLDLIRAVKARRAVPCILCSGYGAEISEAAARAAGADAFFTKPLDLADLAAAVARLVHPHPAPAAPG